MVTRKGKFIVIEGVDGSGVSTQAGRLRNWIEEKLQLEVFLTKEPSEGPAGAMIRLALAKRFEKLDPYTISLMFATDRMDHTHRDILPRLEMGVNVVSDRYYLSNYAYQSLEVDLAWLKQLNSHCIEPDLVIFLDVAVPICVKRMASKRWERQLYEDDPVRLEKVRQSYLSVIRELAISGHNIEIVEGSLSIAEVTRNVTEVVRKVFSRTRPKPLHQLSLTT